MFYDYDQQLNCTTHHLTEFLGTMYLWNMIEHIHRIVSRVRDRPITVVLNSELGARLELLADTEKTSVPELVEQLLWTAADERLSTNANTDPWQALTPREREAAALACMGYTNREIARQMVISPNTVKTHMRHVLRKFSVSSKIELRRSQAEWDFAEWAGAHSRWPVPAIPVRPPESRVGTRP